VSEKTPYEVTEKLRWLKDSWTGHPWRRVTIIWSAHLTAEGREFCQGPDHTCLAEK